MFNGIPNPWERKREHTMKGFCRLKKLHLSHWFIQQQVAWDHNVSEPISELLNWSQTEEMRSMLMWWAIYEQSSDFLSLEAFLSPSEEREVEDLNLGKRRNCQILASISFHMLIHMKDIDLNEKGLWLFGLNYCNQGRNTLLNVLSCGRQAIYPQ